MSKKPSPQKKKKKKKEKKISIGWIGDEISERSPKRKKRMNMVRSTATLQRLRKNRDMMSNKRIRLT